MSGVRASTRNSYSTGCGHVYDNQVSGFAENADFAPFRTCGVGLAFLVSC